MMKKCEIVKIEISSITKKLLDSKPDFGKSMFSEKGWKENTIKEIMSRDKGYFEMPTVERYSNKPLVFKNKISEKMYDKAHVYFFESDNNFDKVVLYLHGGAYVHNIDSTHAKFCDNLCTLLNAKVCVPCYGVPPYAGCDAAYDLLHKLYDDLLILNKPIYIMGDSAGGGLSLGFLLDLKSNMKKLPEKIVMISPSLDVEAKNPDIEKYEKEDLMLSRYGLVEAVKLWAGDNVLNNYRLSPINGEIKDLPPMLVIVGTKELLYPDIKLFYEKCEENNAFCILIEAEDMFHAFPIIGSRFEESNKCINIITSFINEKNIMSVSFK